MKKRLFTAALAFVLSIGGFVLSAEEHNIYFHDNAMKLVVASKTDAGLAEGLSLLSGTNTETKTAPGTFGYTLNDGEFCSLATAINDAKIDTKTKTATILRRTFQNGEKIQFGFEKDGNFNVVSDPLFYGEYNADSFYQLDFSKDPFDGMIEIYVMGEPLPASTVTMLIALAAAGGFLLYRNRRTRARFSVQA